MAANNQSAGVSPELLEQLGADLKKLPCDAIRVPDRLRAVDLSKVADLKQSIVDHGLINAIAVKFAAEGGGYELIAGAHRLAVWHELYREDRDRYHQIPCVVFPGAMTPDMAKLLEIDENLQRSELTSQQRKCFAGMRVKLREEMFKPKKEGAGKTKGAGGAGAATTGPSWVELKNELGMGRSTAQDWWKEFSTDTGHSGTPPSKNPPKLTEEFIEWLVGAQERKAEESAENTQNERIEAICSYLDKQAGSWGVDVIQEGVSKWLNDQR